MLVTLLLDWLLLLMLKKVTVISLVVHVKQHLIICMVDRCYIFQRACLLQGTLVVDDTLLIFIIARIEECGVCGIGNLQRSVHVR